MSRSRRRRNQTDESERPPEPRAGDLAHLVAEAHADLPSLLPARVRTWAGIAVVGLIGWAGYVLWDVLWPFVVAFAIAGLLDGQLRALERRGYSRVAATVLVFVAFVLLVTASLFYLVPLIVSQLQGLIRDLPRYILEANDWFQEELQPFLHRHHETLQRLNLPEDPQELIDRYSEQINVHITAWMSNLLNYVTGTLGKLLWFVIIPIITFFAMVDLPRLHRRLLDMVPEGSHPSVVSLLRALGVVWTGYLRGLATVAILYGITMAIIFSLLGVRYAVILGLLAGLLYLVPYVGALLIALSAGLVAFFGGNGQILWLLEAPALSWKYTALVVGIALLVNTLFDQLLVPRIVGGSVGLHPVASIFALIVGAKLFGIWGMLLAIPVAASLWIVLLALFPALRPKAEAPTSAET